MTPWANVGDMDTRGSKTSAAVREPESHDENEPSAKLARVEETPSEIVFIDETPEPSTMEVAEIALGNDIEKAASAPIAPPKMGVGMVRKDGQWSVWSTGDSVSPKLQPSSSSSDPDYDSDEETSPVVNDEVSWHAD